MATPMATAVAAGEGTDDTKPFLIEGFIEISIGDEKFRLDGIVGKHLKVEYHKPLEEAVSIGSIVDMVGAVGSGLGLTDVAHFNSFVTGKINELKNSVPALGKVADLLLNTPVKVTDLGIDTQEGKYQFGFGVDLTGQGLAYAGISLNAFGFVITYTKPKE
jgi:hypothetical protein